MGKYNLDSLVFPPIEKEHLIAYIDETTKERGGRIVIAKDSTADAIMLDKVVGPANWKDEISCIVKNPSSGDKLFVTSTLSIKNQETGEWISKIGVGEPLGISDYKDKTAETDAFKRAGFKFGIGRELKRSPRAYIPFDQLGFKTDEKDTTPNVTQMKNAEGEVLYKAMDVLEVLDVEYTGEGYEKSISYLVIKNKLTSKTYAFGKPSNQNDSKTDSTVEPTESIKEAATPPTNVDVPNEGSASTVDEVSEPSAVPEPEKEKTKPEAAKDKSKSKMKQKKSSESSSSDELMCDFGIFLNSPKPFKDLNPVQVAYVRTHTDNQKILDACNELAKTNPVVQELFVAKGIEF